MVSRNAVDPSSGYNPGRTCYLDVQERRFYPED
jgi:hypothetical protein